MRKLLLLLLHLPLTALAVNTFVSPTGNDANDCLSAATACKTLQRGADATVAGGYAQPATVNVADGTYTNPVNIMYYKFVAFVGNCNDPTRVVLTMVAPGPVFTAQDHAILGISCMTVNTMVNGTMGIYARQFAIVDYYKVYFGYMPGGIHINAQEKSKVNCLGQTWITGSAAYHAYAGGQSSISMNCPVAILNTPNFSASFISAVWQSMILMSSASFSGGATGTSYIVDSSLLVKGGVPVPGNSGPIVQNGGMVQ